MRPYKRSEQKRLDLISVKDHTIDSIDDTRVPIARTNKRRGFLHDSQDHGDRRDYPSGDSEAPRRSEVQHQQGLTGEKFNQPRVLAEDRGVHRFRGRDQAAPKKVKDAA